MKQSPGSQPSQPLLSFLSPVARFNIALFTSWTGYWILSRDIAHPALDILVLVVVVAVTWRYHQ